MIRINLLGKKKQAHIPFGLDERFAKLGISVDDIQELRPSLVRLASVIVGLYVGNFVFNYLHDEKLRVLDAELNKLTAKSNELQKELASKRDIRKQMEQLNKEEVELQRQLNAVNALQQGRALAFNTLNDIVDILSKGGKVWLESIRLDSDRKILIAGKSWEYFPVNDFVKAISESTRYSSVLYKEVNAEEAKRPISGVPEQLQKTKKFSVEFKVKGAE